MLFTSVITALLLVACNATPRGTRDTGGWSPDDATINGLEITSVVTLAAEQEANLSIKTEGAWELTETASWLEPLATFSDGDVAIKLRGVREGLTPNSYETRVSGSTASGTARAKVTMRFPTMSGCFVEEREPQSLASTSTTDLNQAADDDDARIFNASRDLGSGQVHVVLSEDAMGSDTDAGGGEGRRGKLEDVLDGPPDVAHENIDRLL
mgnify:CR=1 FL=1